MTMRLVGVDCATDDAKVGLALAAADDAGVRLERALVCGRADSAVDRLAGWVGTSPGPVLLAIDAPLGWPRPLGLALAEHRAGEEIATAPNDMFRRATDRAIQQRLRKTPLDVGADRIARTAHAALRLLGQLRRRTGQPIPLAWSPDFSERVAAIEVYPAATLVGHGLRSVGYKKPAHVAERQEILRGLGRELALDMDVPVLEANADALDAVVCLLAAKDFLAGRAHPPQDGEGAACEGWIWAR